MTYSAKEVITPGVSAQTLAMAFREMASMLSAGLPIDRALESVASTGPHHFKTAMIQLSHSVGNGIPLSEGMKRYKVMFHPVVVAIVSAGEMTGRIDTSFELLSQFFESEARIKRTIQSALIYPTIVVVTAIIAVGILSYIGFMSHAWALRLIWLVGISVGTWLLMRFRFVQAAARMVAMGIPFFGSIMQQLAVSRFCYTFGLLTRAGVPILEALETSQPAIQHPLIERASRMIYSGIRNGNTVEDCIRAEPAFPSIVHNLVGTGEMAGKLDEALIRAADFLRADAEMKIKNAGKFAGPVLVIILGIIVALVVSAFWQSYFEKILGFGELF